MGDLELVGAVVAAVRSLRTLPGVAERDIHERLKEALSLAGLDFSHEVRLGPRSRIDFLVGDVGIEVKKGKVGRGRLVAQLEKYAASERVAAIVVVLGQGVSVPRVIRGKPCVVITLGALWGVALR